MLSTQTHATGDALRPLDASTTGKHIGALDGIRGIAVLLVLMHHFFWGNFYNGSNPIVWTAVALRNVGWMGVDLFFVLSGFLITGILFDTLDTPHYFRNFYGRRVLRIFPLYYTVLLVVVGLSMLLHYAWNPYVLALQFVFLGCLRIPVRGQQPPITLPGGSLNHMWSLMIEEQFYLVWPSVVFLLRRRRSIALAACLCIAGSLAVRFYFSCTQVPAHELYIFYSFTPGRLDGLCMGALLAMLIRSRWERDVLRAAPWALLLGAIGMAFAFHAWPWMDYQRYWAAGVWGFTLIAFTFGSLLLCALRHGSFIAQLFSKAPLRFFGRYSYGLYMLHMPFATLGQHLRPWFQARIHSTVLSNAIPALLGFALTVLVAMASFHFYELKFLRLKKYFHSDPKRPTLDKILEEAEEEESNQNASRREALTH